MSLHLSATHNSYLPCWIWPPSNASNTENKNNIPNLIENEGIPNSLQQANKSTIDRIPDSLTTDCLREWSWDKILRTFPTGMSHLYASIDWSTSAGSSSGFYTSKKHSCATFSVPLPEVLSVGGKSCIIHFSSYKNERTSKNEDLETQQPGFSAFKSNAFSMNTGSKTHSYS